MAETNAHSCGATLMCMTLRSGLGCLYGGSGYSGVANRSGGTRRTGDATQHRRKITGKRSRGMAATAERKKPRHLRVLASHPADSATRTLDLECEGLQALRATLDQQLRGPFQAAVTT